MSERKITAGAKAPSYLRPLFLLFFTVGLLIDATSISAQTCATPSKDGSPGQITGIINTYYPGTASVTASSTSISVGTATGATTAITPGDLLIVIQMQDAAINSANSSSYGNGVSGGAASGYTSANNVGLYEFVAATNSVALSGGTLTLTGTGTGGGLRNAYTNANATGTQGQRRFQVVRVPQYGSVTLSSGLTARAWNGTTGGILALDAQDNVALSFSTISVVGLGFRGGAGLQLTGSGGSDSDYRNTAPTSSTTTTGFHGAKGEGIAGTPRYVWTGSAIVDTGVEGYPNGSMARGAPGNAGGGGTDGRPTGASPGGNDENSGGGGGGNGGAGGVGGNSWNSQQVVGGYGGVVLTQATAGRVVMGGGGAAGTRNNNPGDASASSAAAGGGIVIIRARFVVGTGTIDASGAAAYNNTLNDGAGGGGGGGSVIVLSLSSNPTGLTVLARGGRGGDAWRTEPPAGDPGERHGPGGGGGGGRIFLSGSAASLSLTGGANGITTTVSASYGATAGANGTTATNMTASQIPGVSSAAECIAEPTEAHLLSFQATRYQGGTILEWQTGYEMDNIGFNIYREDQSGSLTRLTQHLVAGSALMVRRGTPLTSGLSYLWSDTDAKFETAVRYWLEDLDSNGEKTWHGPYGINELPEASIPQLPGKARSPLISSLNDELINIQRQAMEAQDPAYEPLGQVEREAKLSKLTPLGLAHQTDLAGRPAVKISVRQEGYYRVNQPQLVAAGLSASVDPRKLQLFVDGQQLPIFVQGEKDGKLDPSDSIEFYGLGLDTPSTDSRVYWLIAGAQPGDRIKQIQSASGATGGGLFAYTVQRRDRLHYFANIKNGEAENFFGAFIYNQPTDQLFNVANLAPAADAKLELAMQGFGAVPHQIAISVNGAFVGTMSFTGQVYSVSKLTFPQSLLVEGSNTISLVAQAGENDFSFVDYLRLTYSHNYSADANSLKFTAAPGRSVTIDGFTDSKIRVVDVTDPKSAQEILGKVSEESQGFSFTLTTPGTGNRTLIAFIDSQTKQAAKVAPNVASSWREASNSADLIIITHGEFSSTLQSLKSLRERQGLQTQIVNIEDVYDEFSFGIKSPQALKDFLSHARATWRKAPRYVLLAGTASLDPRNYLGLGFTDLVPTKLVETQRNETASDDSLADSDGDGIAEIAVGRLPARSLDEAARMVQKLVQYDQPSESGIGALLVADANSGFNFESANEQIRSLIPPSTPVQEIRRGSDPLAKQHLLEALNQGKKVVNYVGHGSIGFWKDNLLNTSDAAALSNGQKLPVVVAMTCLNGYFIDERLESLAHALINAQSGGAIAVWSSSGLTGAANQALADQELFRQLFGGPSIRLGDATIKAKTAVTDPDIRRTWILIGDPSMRFTQ